MKIFDESKPFWKGNFHCHTTRSDGRRSPEEVMEVYRAHGYDFLTLTDHRLLSEQTHLSDGMLMLSGVEMDFELCAEALHITGFGMDESFSSDRSWLRSPQSCIDAMRRHGGRAILAHPAWSLNTMATLTSLRGLTAAEIYNTMSNAPWNGQRANSSGILDVTAAHGRLYNFVAADDAHYYAGEECRSYTMVQADELSQSAIIEAMDAGSFYCSQGPQFQQLTLENGLLTVRCSPVDQIIFYSNLVWSSERCRAGKGLTDAAYHLDGGDTFVRVQLVDAQGNSAWSNPIALAGQRQP